MQIRDSSHWHLLTFKGYYYIHKFVKKILNSIVRAITNFIQKFPHHHEQLHEQKIISEQNYLTYRYISVYNTTNKAARGEVSLHITASACPSPIEV